MPATPIPILEIARLTYTPALRLPGLDLIGGETFPVQHMGLCSEGGIRGSRQLSCASQGMHGRINL